MQGRQTPLVIAALLAGMTLPTAASAQEPPAVAVYGESADARTEHVSFADLSLASLSDQKVLTQRVGRAVKRVCLYEPEVRLQPSDYNPCAAGAWAGAQPQIAEAVARSQALALSGQPAPIATAISISAR